MRSSERPGATAIGIIHLERGSARLYGPAMPGSPAGDKDGHTIAREVQEIIMGDDNKKTAILFLTHIKNKNISEQFLKLRCELSPSFDVFMLCDNTSGKFSRHAGDEGRFLFEASQFLELDYPGKLAHEKLSRSDQGDYHHQRFNFGPGNVELPVLLFFKTHPEYDRYWTIEYDVRFTGRWDTLLSAFEASDADLVGTTLTRYAEIPDWFHWPSLDLRGKRIAEDQYLRGFLPIYRLSRRALEQLDRDYREGVSGHLECLIPTLLNHVGMTIEDIGGDGEFVRPGNVNRFYRNTPTRGNLEPGTFVFRPIMERPGNEPDTLWHPVKAKPMWKIALRPVGRAMRQLARPLSRNGPAPTPASARTGPSPHPRHGKPIIGPERGDRLN